ncbi:MAG: hypothetical protein ACRDGL_05385 [Candidatus Limnocylindrales bacterium]
MGSPLTQGGTASTHPLRRPVGVLGLLGGALVLVGTLAPWVTGQAPDGTVVTVNGFTGAGDGSMALLFAVLLVLALASAAIAGSRTRIAQLLPAVLGIGSGLYMAVAVRGLPQTLEGLRNLGVEPVVQAGFWIEVAGAAVTALAGLAATLLIVRRNPVRREAAADVDALDRTFVARLFTRLGGAIVGTALGVWLAVQTFGSTGSPFVPASALVGLLAGLGAAALLLGLFGPSGPRRGR